MPKEGKSSWIKRYDDELARSIVKAPAAPVRRRRRVAAAPAVPAGSGFVREGELQARNAWVVGRGEEVVVGYLQSERRVLFRKRVMGLKAPLQVV